MGDGDLSKWRDEFPILSRTVYMISNSLGAMPRQTARNLAEYADTWATRGVRAWEDRWWEMPAEIGDKIAGIVGAPAGTVSMHENVTTAEMVALSSVRPSASRKRLVCSAMDFPSMIYLYRAQQAAGFELQVVPAEGDLTVHTGRMLDAIDDRTAVVAFSHVLFRTSYIVDAHAIVGRARDVGATVILDTYQSAGIIPLDVTALGVEFAVGGCLKWLCGGPGNAFLYTRPDLLKHAKPSFTGWVSREHPFAFNMEDDVTRRDAMHMMNGTPSIPAYYAALAGLDIIHAVGVDRIRQQSQRLTARLLALADEYGFASAASREPDRLAGTVALNVPDAPLVSRTLKAREFIVDYRPPVGVRISPHFYNTMEEVDRVMAEIASIVATKDYDSGETHSLVT
ncbi:MAG: kynureninase [Acidobacteria bacterium]|nr:MAG: kynureninase [Acidobacteriota bacterium]PYR21048.1 MAG: kynureninase [Acidobacteriota bacterium]PYR54434.1 MAG: kynureninase [Acidobacteriota bacterium]